MYFVSWPHTSIAEQRLRVRSTWSMVPGRIAWLPWSGISIKLSTASSGQEQSPRGVH